MRSASTIEMPIVTMVWRSSWPCMKRNTETCSRKPDQRGRGEAGGDGQEPVVGEVAHDPADIGAEQKQRAMRQVDVAHQAEDQGEAARHQEIERRQRHAVQHGRDELPGVGGVGPDDEHDQRHADRRQPEPRPEPSGDVHAAGRLQRVRLERSSGSLWKAPSFMMPSSLLRSSRMREVRQRIAVDQQQVGQEALLDLAQLVAPAS